MLQYQLDICGPVTPEMLELLVAYSPGPAAKKYLNRYRFEYLSTSDISRNLLTRGQLMKQAASKAVWSEEVFSTLISIMPRLRLRYVSIVSSPRVNPSSIAIIAGVLETPIAHADRGFIGLTACYLHSLHLKENQLNSRDEPEPSNNLEGPRSIVKDRKLFAHIRKSRFKLSDSDETPIILIAAGSGITPFRAFVQKRKPLSSKGISVGKMVLFYGSRSEEDCLYKDV